MKEKPSLYGSETQNHFKIFQIFRFFYGNLHSSPKINIFKKEFKQSRKTLE